MRTLTLFFVVTACLVGQQPGQKPASQIIYGPTLPASCNPALGQVFFKTAATLGTYQCLTTNTWTAMGGSGGSTPASSVTAGTFGAGDYVFPGNLAIGSTSLNATTLAAIASGSLFYKNGTAFDGAPLSTTPAIASQTAVGIGVSVSYSDSPNFVGIGLDGFAQFAVVDGNSDAVYVHCQNLACTVTDTATMATPTNGNSFISLAVGSDGFSRFIYQASDGIHFVQCKSIDCATPSPSNTLIVSPSTYEMALYLTSDIATVVYTDSTGVGISVCSDQPCSSLSSTNFITDGVNAVYAQDVALNPGTGFASVLLVDRTHYELKLYNCSNGPCSSGSLIDLGVKGYYEGALRIGADGFFRIMREWVGSAPSYSDANAMLIRCTNASCSASVTSVIRGSTGGGAGLYIAFAMSGNLPSIVTQNNGDNSIQFLRCGDLDCTPTAALRFAEYAPTGRARALGAALAGSSLLTIFRDQSDYAYGVFSPGSQRAVNATWVNGYPIVFPSDQNTWLDGVGVFTNPLQINAVIGGNPAPNSALVTDAGGLFSYVTGSVGVFRYDGAGNFSWLAGLTQTLTVKGSGGSDCDIALVGGIATATTCP